MAHNEGDVIDLSARRGAREQRIVQLRGIIATLDGLEPLVQPDPITMQLGECDEALAWIDQALAGLQNGSTKELSHDDTPGGDSTMSATITPIHGAKNPAGAAEIDRLATGLESGDRAGLTTRYQAEAKHIRAIAEARVATGAALDALFGATLACADCVDFRRDHFDHLRYATFEEYAAGQGRYLVQCRELLEIEPGPLAALAPSAAARAAHVWPPVSIRPTSLGERADGLQAGLPLLEEVIATEARKLAALRAMQRAARRMFSRSAFATIPPADRAAWDHGWAVLDRDYCENDAASRAERLLGIYCGQRVFVSGGSIVDEGEFIPYPVDDLTREVEEYGLAEGSAPLP